MLKGKETDQQTNIPLVILAGGMGTRMGHLTQNVPKPMLEVHGMPILLHIMAQYAKYGVREFHILAGYKSAYIKEYFSKLLFNVCSIKFSYDAPNRVDFEHIEDKWGIKDWVVTIHETGFNSETGERLRRIKDKLPHEFYFTYGDGLSDFDPVQTLTQLRQSSSVAVICAFIKKERFGNILLDDNGSVVDFKEKISSQGSWINAGYMCLSDAVFDYINGPNDSFETDVLPRIVNDSKLSAVKHHGFWQALDHERELEQFNSMAACYE